MKLVNKYIDKATIFILSAVFYIEYYMDIYLVVPLICVIIVSAFLSYMDDAAVKVVTAIVYFVICAIYPIFLFFLPVIFYDVFYTKYQAGLAFAMIPVVLGFQTLPLTSCIFIVLFIGLSYLIKRRTTVLDRTRNDYIALRDSTKEFSLLLERKNKELMEKQDYEVNLATLNERNRIARDIHDSVGHILSNAILQTGALLATCGDEALKEKLRVLKDTLSTGMDSVRSSVHDLYDESIDIYSEIKRLCDGFDFCEIVLDYDMDSNPEKTVKYTLLSVAKEAFSNIMRHSDATQVRVTVREHPALYQLIIRDNGTQKNSTGDGIGLKNIAQRVETLGGIVNIGYDNGFTVFVSIPKAR